MALPLWWEGLGEQWRQALGVAAVLLWLALVVLLALQTRAHWPQRPEWSRKVLHIGTGPVVLIAWGLGIERWIALPAAAVVTVAAALNHRFRLLPAVDDVGRASYGTVAYGAAITTLMALFWPQRSDAVAAGVLVMACGDGLAGLLGASIASPSWTIAGQRKSLLGTATMGLVSLGVLVALRLALPAGGGPGPSLPALVAIAVAAMLLEQFALLGIDNLAVPVAVGLLWALLGAQT